MFSTLNPIPSLPQHPGRYRVGTSEFEIPVSEISSNSAVPDPAISTVKFRIFYPTTSDATTSTKLYWLPSPQSRWTEAYASFMGASPRVSSLISKLPSFLNYVKLPAIHHAPLSPRTDDLQYPLTIFSHGLGGNYNTYSSVVGALASCGVVCVAPEHRDGSAPISFIRNACGEFVKEVEYKKLSHSPSTEVLNARNSQLRIRCWELELIYNVIKGMNEGKTFTNYAESQDKEGKRFSHMLNMNPGKVTWAGHSFGAATMTQFVKSIYYRQNIPVRSAGLDADEWDWTPLYKPGDESQVVQQITPKSPMALLDLWTMPLRGETTKWLWEKPLPCYERTAALHGGSTTPSVVAIMSAEFYKWTDLLNRTRAILSPSPVKAAESLQKNRADSPKLPAGSVPVTSPIPEVSKQDASPVPSSVSTRSPSPSNKSDVSAPATTVSSESSVFLSDSVTAKTQDPSSIEPHLYLVLQSAHLSQSDFGPLFPNLTRFAMKAIAPQKTIELNVRAILGIMKARNLAVEGFGDEEDQILNGKGLGEEQRWLRVALMDL